MRVDCPSGNAVREVYNKVVDMLSEETEKVSKGKDYENGIHYKILTTIKYIIKCEYYKYILKY